MPAGGGGVVGKPVSHRGRCSYVGYGPGTWGAAGGEGLPHDAAPANPVYLAALTSLPLSSFMELDRKSTRLNSSHVRISYAVFCLKKKKKKIKSKFFHMRQTNIRYD